jgi:hypothetical protein
MELHAVSIKRPDGLNVIAGHAHFIKTVEDIHEALVGTSSHLRFGLAFFEASGPCVVRRSGNDDELVTLAVDAAQAIAAGHTFVVLMRLALAGNRPVRHTRSDRARCHLVVRTGPLRWSRSGGHRRSRSRGRTRVHGCDPHYRPDPEVARGLARSSTHLVRREADVPRPDPTTDRWSIGVSLLAGGTGVAVALLARDVVVGVAVGTAFFAVVTRLVKAGSALLSGGGRRGTVGGPGE